MNRFYLRRATKLVINNDALTGNVRSDTEIAIFQKNLSFLGYMMSEELAEQVRQMEAAPFESFYHEVMSELRSMTGDKRSFNPMYRDFPAEVANMPDAELYLNALYHYITLDLPKRKKINRPELLDHIDPTVIGLGTNDDLETIFSRLCATKNSLSDTDQHDLELFVKIYGGDIESLIPDEIPRRETMAVIAACLIKHAKAGVASVSKHVKTANDVLRVAAALSEGDVSLFEPCKFKAIPRRQRRALLECVERCPNLTADMMRWKERWVRLGERLHPGEYQDKYPRTYEAFCSLRNGSPSESEESVLERKFNEKDVEGLIELLSLSPGIFARRLDHLLRTAPDPEVVLIAFEKIARQVPTPILLRMKSHFSFREIQRKYDTIPVPKEEPPMKAVTKKRGQFLKSLINFDAPKVKLPEPIEIHNELIRVFFPKGDVAKVFARAEPLPLLPEGVAARAAEICTDALIGTYSKLPTLGKCWVDPALMNYRTPTAQRSAAKALRTISRGSRLALPDANTLRCFVWWMNGDYRTDLDLSAGLFDTHFRYVDVLSYYNLKAFGGHHSGDIVDAPEGAAEFIDLNIDHLLSRKIRYVVMSVYSYTQQPFCDLPECFAGWMARQHPESGEIFEARTVQDKYDLAADTKISLPAIFDLEKREVIWCDLALRAYPSFNNLESNLSGVSLMIRSMVSLKTPTLHELFSLHAEARGELVERREHADMVFSETEGDVTAFDLEAINAEYL